MNNFVKLMTQDVALTLVLLLLLQPRRGRGRGSKQRYC